MDLHDDVRPGDMQPPKFLLIEHFEPHVGKIFQFEGTSYALPLQSIISKDQPLPDGIKRQPFTRSRLARGTWRSQAPRARSPSVFCLPLAGPEP